ncbi:Pogo transposable element with ZNF domain [Frankliniella fusca]|uniref:Pogo transposable element with ZNF domain n=1 Tax=Frankliniella fusca TaxID=407009 RepID=A0AAE1LIT1_9NEOP|nr:Pogo transposable element with ZNF domain [Frankliniella fusca]
MKGAKTEKACGSQFSSHPHPPTLLTPIIEIVCVPSWARLAMRWRGISETAQCQCPGCGRWMTQCNLRRHYRDQHMPNQARRCPRCGKWFRNLSSMQSHKSKYHRTTATASAASSASGATSSAAALAAPPQPPPPPPQLVAGTWTPAPPPLPPLPPLYSLEGPGLGPGLGLGLGLGPGSASASAAGAVSGQGQGLSLQQVPPPVRLENHQLDHEHDIRMAQGLGQAQQSHLVCPVCGKRFSNPTNRQRHLDNLHGKNQGPFQCTVCFKMAKNKNALDSHVYYYHRKGGGGKGPLRRT